MAGRFLKESRSALEEEIEELEVGLKEAYALSGMQGDWINTDSHRFKVSQHPGRLTLNREALKLEFLDALGGEHAAEKLESREFLFIRVGEDSDDTEIQGSFWGNPLGMRLVRSVVFS